MQKVSIDTVQGFAEVKAVSGSYMQTERHGQVSDRFTVIQPAAVGAAMGEQGFKLVSCITGKGRHADKVDFQRTISRYRHSETFGIDNLSLDIIYISKHLGRGCDEMRLGLYRGVCANQWAVGTLFELVKVRHTGNVADDIQTGIGAVLSQRGKLLEMIEKMRATTLTPSQIEELCQKYAAIRLEGKENIVKVDFKKLARVHRQDDAKLDLFSVANVLQENVVRMPLGYDVNAVDGQGNPYIRHMTTRRLRDSSSQLVDLNGKLFDAAAELIAA